MNKQPCIGPHGTVDQISRTHTLHSVRVQWWQKLSTEAQNSALPGTDTNLCSSVFSRVISLHSWISSILCRHSKADETWTRLSAATCQRRALSPLSYWAKMEQRELDCDAFPTGWGKVSSDWRELRPPWEALLPASLSLWCTLTLVMRLAKTFRASDAESKWVWWLITTCLVLYMQKKRLSKHSCMLNQNAASGERRTLINSFLPHHCVYFACL